MQEKPFTLMTLSESENWLKEHAGSWRSFMTVPLGFIFSCCGEVKTGGSNHEHDVIKIKKKGWVHGSCKSGIVLMKFPAVMEKESSYRRWRIEVRRKALRRLEG